MRSCLKTINTQQANVKNKIADVNQDFNKEMIKFNYQ